MARSRAVRAQQACEQPPASPTTATSARVGASIAWASDSDAQRDLFSADRGQEDIRPAVVLQISQALRDSIKHKARLRDLKEGQHLCRFAFGIPLFVSGWSQFVGQGSLHRWLGLLEKHSGHQHQAKKPTHSHNLYLLCFETHIKPGQKGRHKSHTLPARKDRRATPRRGDF